MQDPNTSTNTDYGDRIPGGTDRFGTERPADDVVTRTVPGGSLGARPHIQAGQDVLEVRDRIQWGPIVGGLVTAVATLVVLTVLGLAIGASAFEPTAAGEDLGWFAAIWGAVSAIIAFFAGGYVAAKTAAVAGPGTGLINGFMVGAAALTLILILSGTGLANALGAVGTDIDQIANVTQTGTAEAADAEAAVRDNFDAARDGAWGTLIGLLVALGAASLGGLLGHNKREELISGTSAGR